MNSGSAISGLARRCRGVAYRPRIRWANPGFVSREPQARSLPTVRLSDRARHHALRSVAGDAARRASSRTQAGPGSVEAARPEVAVSRRTGREDAGSYWFRGGQPTFSQAVRLLALPSLS